MSWFGWRRNNGGNNPGLSVFESAQLSAMQDIVRQYEETNRQYHDLLYWLATRILPGKVDQRLSENPFAFANMTPDGWREFFQDIADNTHFLHGSAHSLHLELQRENERLRQQLAAAEIQIAQLKAERDWLQQQNAPAELPQEAPGGAKDTTSDTLPPASIDEDHQPETSSEEPPFRFPEAYPRQYQALFTHQQETKWRREVAAIAILAGLGYSAETSLRWEIVQYVQQTPAAQGKQVLTNPDSGSIKRLIASLEENKLIERIPVNVGQSRIIILRLTELGRNVARAMGVPIVESEWERLMRLHGGERQQKHAAMVCLFTAYARRRGWRTEVCPEVEPPADPDVLIEKDDERIYVEVEAGSGTVERRMRKWRNQRNLQGFVAICAPNEKTRRELVQEARGNTKRGMATDLIWLRGKPREDNALWAETW